MKIPPNIIEAITNSENKALATSGKCGLNVVPVSTIRVFEDKIILMNYFLRKTLGNISENPRAALACWKGLSGYQIKGTVRYIDAGLEFEKMRVWVENNVKNRTLKGILELTPEEIYDVSPPVTM